MLVLLDVAVRHVSPRAGGVVWVVEGDRGQGGLCDEEDVEGEDDEGEEGDEGGALAGLAWVDDVCDAVEGGGGGGGGGGGAGGGVEGLVDDGEEGQAALARGSHVEWRGKMALGVRPAMGHGAKRLISNLKRTSVGGHSLSIARKNKNKAKTGKPSCNPGISPFRSRPTPTPVPSTKLSTLRRSRRLARR